MTIITSGDASGAPYRRLWVLENLEGLAYENADQQNIEATMAQVAGNGVYLGQLENIIARLQNEKLATFERGGQGEYGYGTWQEHICIKHLNLDLLKKLKQETQAYIRKKDGEEEPEPEKSKPAPKQTPRVEAKPQEKYHARHPVQTTIYTGVVIALTVSVITAIVPSARNYFLSHVIHHSAHK